MIPSLALVTRLSRYNEVSRLHAKSKNYEMDLTLDYNIELFPLKAGQTFTLSLATSLSRGSVPGKEGEEDKEQQWRPDGKGQKGIEEDYEYVMFGKVRAALDVEVFHFIDGRLGNRYTSLTQERRCRTSCLLPRPKLYSQKINVFPPQYCLRFLWGSSNVAHWLIPPHDQRRSRGIRIRVITPMSDCLHIYARRSNPDQGAGN
jgi:hypothetical protein